jgi:hypothetical protein
MKISTLCAVLALSAAGAFLPAPCFASESAPPAPQAPAAEVHLTGTIDNEVAIGGETTGWFLRYGEGRRVQLLLPLDAFSWIGPGDAVAVTGHFETRETPERGRHEVFVVRTISHIVA